MKNITTILAVLAIPAMTALQSCGGSTGKDIDFTNPVAVAEKMMFATMNADVDGYMEATYTCEMNDEEAAAARERINQLFTSPVFKEKSEELSKEAGSYKGYILDELGYVFRGDSNFVRTKIHFKFENNSEDARVWLRRDTTTGHWGVERYETAD